MTAFLTPVSPPATRRRSPGHLALIATGLLGTAWNAFGVVQWAGTLRATADTLMGGGLSAVQAAVYLGLPVWMTAAFGVGVLGGLAGSLALVGRRRAATPGLVASLAAYVALYAGDVVHGLFDVLPSQQDILNAVLAIAVTLLVAAVAARRHGLLR